MKISNRELMNRLRAKYVKNFMEFARNMGEEAMQTASNQFTFPVVDEAGGERWIQVVVKVPTGARKDEVAAYDGYVEAEDYEFRMKEAEKKKNEKEKVKP